MTAGEPAEQRRPRPATPTDVSAAIAERRRRERRRRRLLVGAVAGLLALSLLLVWLVRFSSVLAVRTVEVTGTRLVDAKQVEQAAEVPLGTPIARLETGPVAQRVVDRLTPVGSVRVRTRLPGTVVLEVSERTPVYERRTATGYQWVDAAGVIFHTEAKHAKGRTIVTTPGVQNRTLADIATVVAALPPALAQRVDHVTAASGDDIVLVLDKGQQVRWGSAAASADKAKVAMVLLGQKATVFDVSSPGSPSTR
ncbi:cell division protein FtsQ/DivIB [Luteococcus peritonei]|uniref:Cell division protein FtsQ/DivIB n=1 Tax=Luteococcus peritonei TaxID=88874 RepID=A0ABW4RR19_9ACTN